MIFRGTRPRAHIHERRECHRTRKQIEWALHVEKAAPALFRLLFQNDKQDKGVRDHDGHKVKTCIKAEKINTRSVLSVESVHEILNSCKNFTVEIMYYIGPTES